MKIEFRYFAHVIDLYFPNGTTRSCSYLSTLSMVPAQYNDPNIREFYEKPYIEEALKDFSKAFNRTQPNFTITLSSEYHSETSPLVIIFTFEGPSISDYEIELKGENLDSNLRTWCGVNRNLTSTKVKDFSFKLKSIVPQMICVTP